MEANSARERQGSTATADHSRGGRCTRTADREHTNGATGGTIAEECEAGDDGHEDGTTGTAPTATAATADSIGRLKRELHGDAAWP